MRLCQDAEPQGSRPQPHGSAIGPSLSHPRASLGHARVRPSCERIARLRIAEAANTRCSRPRLASFPRNRRDRTCTERAPWRVTERWVPAPGPSPSHPFLGTHALLHTHRSTSAPPPRPLRFLSRREQFRASLVHVLKCALCLVVSRVFGGLAFSQI